jgi:hypothetical protein
MRARRAALSRTGLGTRQTQEQLVSENFHRYSCANIFIAEALDFMWRSAREKVCNREELLGDECRSVLKSSRRGIRSDDVSQHKENHDDKRDAHQPQNDRHDVLLSWVCRPLNCAWTVIVPQEICTRSIFECAVPRWVASALSSWPRDDRPVLVWSAKRPAHIRPRKVAAAVRRADSTCAKSCRCSAKVAAPSSGRPTLTPNAFPPPRPFPGSRSHPSRRRPFGRA